MNKKGLANIYWFVIAVAVLIIVGIAWLATETNPINYTSEMGRRQAVTLNGYISAEEVRMYNEEAAKLSVFYLLRELGVPKTCAGTNNCFDFSLWSINGDEFAGQLFSSAMEEYIIAHPLNNQYSDIVPAIYHRFHWTANSAIPPPSPLPPESDAPSWMYPMNGGEDLRIIGVSDGDTQVWNSRYFFIYSISGVIDVTITSDEYKEYMDLYDGTTANIF